MGVTGSARGADNSSRTACCARNGRKGCGAKLAVMRLPTTLFAQPLVARAVRLRLAGHCFFGVERPAAKPCRRLVRSMGHAKARPVLRQRQCNLPCHAAPQALAQSKDPQIDTGAMAAFYAASAPDPNTVRGGTEKSGFKRADLSKCGAYPRVSKLRACVNCAQRRFSVAAWGNEKKSSSVQRTRALSARWIDMATPWPKGANGGRTSWMKILPPNRCTALRTMGRPSPLPLRRTFSPR